jgi:hypothetical protein
MSQPRKPATGYHPKQGRTIVRHADRLAAILPQTRTTPRSRPGRAVQGHWPGGACRQRPGAATFAHPRFRQGTDVDAGTAAGKPKPRQNHLMNERTLTMPEEQPSRSCSSRLKA